MSAPPKSFSIRRAVYLTLTGKVNGVTSNKFYEMLLLEKEGSFSVETRYGRLRSPGTTETSGVESWTGANKRIDLMRRAKLNKGYVLMQDASVPEGASLVRKEGQPDVWETWWPETTPICPNCCVSPCARYPECPGEEDIPEEAIFNNKDTETSRYAAIKKQRQEKAWKFK